MATPESQAHRQILVLRLLRHVRSIAARTCEINKPDVEHGNLLCSANRSDLTLACLNMVCEEVRLCSVKVVHR